MKKIIIILPIIFLILFTLSLTSLFFQTGRNESSVTVEIKAGTSASVIADFLRSENIIRSKFGFKASLYLLGMGHSVKAGCYRFDPYEPLFKTVFKLAKGEILTDGPVKVTFPEGSSIYKMGTIMEKEGISDYGNFRNLVDSGFIAKYSAEFPFLKSAKDYSLEGFLFPDTYIVNKNISYETLATLMLIRFNGIIWTYWEQNSKDAKLSFYDTLILASIIEKEAQLPEERPIISSVFYNRLKINMPLAADPTVKYGLESPTKRVYLKQLNIKSPYNTYRRRGLPPTPICNPGLDSFKAAVFPAETDYLYFVARKNGSHIFSKSWKDHQKARQSL